MKRAITLMLVMFAVAAHAELIVPKGAKATLQVTYQFKSNGKFTGSAKDVISDWNVQRKISITALYVAEAPQPFGALHSSDKKQNADIKDMQKKTASAATKMQPTMMDMMKIVEKCNENEACIEREVTAYGMNMEVTPDMKSARQDIADVTSAATATRFQMWKLTSQQGTYRIDEQRNKQVFEMTCTQTQVCKRSETRSGGGSIPAPAGGKSSEGASILEVDSTGRNMMVMLPVPLAPLAYTQTVVTTIPDETSGTTKSVTGAWMLDASKPGPVNIPGDLKTVSGSQTYQVKGDQADGGTITVDWTFTRQ